MADAEIEEKLRVIEQDEDLGSLNEAMTRHYGGNRIQTRRGTVFHSGEVVAARLDTEGGWFRARVIETTAAAPHGEKQTHLYEKKDKGPRKVTNGL